jgi:uncharacterized membrane protein YeiH
MNINEQVLAALSHGAGLGKGPTREFYTGTDPAANTEFSDTIPAGEMWHLHIVAFTIVQGATQTPLPTLIITDAAGEEVYAQDGASAAQSASVTSRYFFVPGALITAGAALTRNKAPLAPNLILPGGFIIKSSTAGKGANTNIGAPRYLITRYN